MKIKIEFEVNGSSYSAEDAESRIQYAIESYRLGTFSKLVVDLIRLLNAKTWGETTVEVKED